MHTFDLDFVRCMFDHFFDIFPSLYALAILYSGTVLTFFALLVVILFLSAPCCSIFILFSIFYLLANFSSSHYVLGFLGPPLLCRFATTARRGASFATAAPNCTVRSRRSMARVCMRPFQLRLQLLLLLRQTDLDWLLRLRLRAVLRSTHRCISCVCVSVCMCALCICALCVCVFVFFCLLSGF